MVVMLISFVLGAALMLIGVSLGYSMGSKNQATYIPMSDDLKQFINGLEDEEKEGKE